jgi:SAM-dependent methyltransferase
MACNVCWMEAGLTPLPDPTRDERLRRDLARIHRAMGSATIVRRAIDRLGLAMPPRRVLDLGAGDGTLLLRVARAMPPSWKGVELTLLDLHDVVTDRTRKAFAGLGWQTRVEKVDVIDWANAAHPGGYDLCLSVLFLHRLDKAARAQLLPAIARRSMAFVACEPRRSAVARAGSHFVRLLGSSETMRDDAIAGVDAGFSGRELSGAWPPAPGAWALDEYAAGLFMHCFSAVRVTARALDRRDTGR